MKNSNKKMATVAAVAALALAGVTGGVVAKYVTSGSAEDSARVAKFGVEITDTSDAFAATYATDDADTKATIAYSVTSDDGTSKVVAPGTSGDLLAVSITGTPEVAVEVKNTATVDLGDNWKVTYTDADSVKHTDEYYCPLVITVGSTEYYGMDYDSVDDFEDAVEDALTSTAKYAPNQDLSKVDGNTSATWAWDFENHDAKQTDVKDTYLGDQAAAGNAATISVKMETSVTQID